MRRLGQRETYLGLVHAYVSAWCSGGVRLWLGLALTLTAAPLHAAEPQPAQAGASDQAVTVGQVTVNGRRQSDCPATAPGGHGLNFACLNTQLKSDADAEAGAPPPPAANRDALVPSKVGTFSQTATAERLGKNFGHSVQPYRPPPPVYANPVTAGKPR